MYATAVEQAAALFHAIIGDHPFADGNKRTATVLSLLCLVGQGVIAVPVTDLQLRFVGELAVATASSNIDVDDVAYWLERILGPWPSGDEPGV